MGIGYGDIVVEVYQFGQYCCVWYDWNVLVVCFYQFWVVFVDGIGDYYVVGVQYVGCRVVVYDVCFQVGQVVGCYVVGVV